MGGNKVIKMSFIQNQCLKLQFNEEEKIKMNMSATVLLTVKVSLGLHDQNILFWIQNGMVQGIIRTFAVLKMIHNQNQCISVL